MEVGGDSSLRPPSSGSQQISDLIMGWIQGLSQRYEQQIAEPTSRILPPYLLQRPPIVQMIQNVELAQHIKELIP